MYYFDLSGLYLLLNLGMAMLSLLFVAHLGWLMSLWENRLRRPAPTHAARLWFAVAMLTPILGFYALRLADRLRGRALNRPMHPWWRGLMMPLSAALLSLAAWQVDQQYAPEYRSLDSVLGNMGLLALYFLVAAAVVHMAASVFALTRHGLLTSRIPPMVAGFFLLLTLA